MFLSTTEAPMSNALWLLSFTVYNPLKELGIQAFLDSEEKELGNSFPSTIETAILSAKVHIAIFSKRYAESAWCLAELVLMLQSKARIIPVFYQVKPSDLRHIETGVYAEAYLRHAEKGRYLDNLKKWKEALQQVSYTAGYEFKQSDSNDCKDIVSAIEKEVQRTKLLLVAKYPVGLHKLVKEFEKQCLDELVQDFESQCGMKKAVRMKANVVGIFGMGGVGKTTLSKELFNQKRSEYTRASFLFDVREACASGKLPSLQSKLLKDIFCEDRNFLNGEEGTSYLRDRFERNKSFSFIIVLDDIDHVEQFDALLFMDILVKSGNNLIIITTRDVGVLVSKGIDIGYHLKGLDIENGRELFCWHAFDQPLPLSGYEKLVQDFVNMCAGLPLSLIVLGRHVSGRSKWYWQDELEKVKKTLPGDVKKRLKIGIDTLDNVEKQIFMDIACFFIGKPITMAMPIWKGSGWRARRAFRTLKEKCLVQEVEVKYLDLLDRSDLGMHDHLRDLGREMANELSHPRRVWHPQHLKSLELKGFRNIVAQTKGRCFQSILDESIGCAITYFLGEPEDGSDTSLLWLQVEYPRYRPLDLNSDINSNILSCIPLQNLQCLIISNVCFQKLWQSDVEAPSNLKELQITGCKNFKRLSATPDLCKLVQLKISGCQELEELRIALMSCLEKITIENCDQLKSVSGISNLSKLVELEISGCHMLEFEYLCLSGMKCLEKITVDRYVKMKYFELDGCEILKTIMFDCKNIVKLSIRYCAELDKLPDLTGPSCLERIIVDGCENLKYLRLNGLQNLESVSGNFELRQLDIIKCAELEELPSLARVSCLEQIKIDSCEKLHDFTLPTTLIKLHVQRCRDLQMVALPDDYTKLTRLFIIQCPAFEELPSLARLTCLEEIVIKSCEKLQSIRLPKTLIKLDVQRRRDFQIVAAAGDFTKLKWLFIKQCPVLEGLPSLARLSCLEEIVIDSCEKLQNITLPTTLINLDVQGCRDLQRIAGASDLTKLTRLFIKQCPALEELPSFTRVSCSQNIKIDSCEKLQKFMLPTTLINLYVQRCRDLQKLDGIADLTNLRLLTIEQCPALEGLPSLARLSCLEQIMIDSCEKLQNITLPARLVNLNVQRCRHFQIIGGVGDLTMLERLIIKQCPAVKELPSLSRVNWLKEIVIDSCEKLQNITLPKTLFTLNVQNCRDLQRVAGASDLRKVIVVIIKQCPALEEFQALARLSCMEEIKIDSCEKLQNISGAEEFLALQWMKLSYCSNAFIRNCIHKLKSLPSHSTFLTGRAADGAESILNENLFGDANIGVIQIGTDNTNPEWSKSTATVIACFVVVVDSSTSVADINKSVSYHFPKVRKGEWIITVVGSEEEFKDNLETDVTVLRRYGILKKGFMLELKKGEERKGVGALHTIVGSLHY